MVTILRAKNVFNQLDNEIWDDIFLIKSTGNGEEVLNDYKALPNTSLTSPSYIHAIHKEKLPTFLMITLP
jgi:hypothetical protein